MRDTALSAVQCPLISNRTREYTDNDKYYMDFFVSLLRKKKTNEQRTGQEKRRREK